MINQPLNSCRFEYNDVFYNDDFEEILAAIIACYFCLVTKKIKVPSNDENAIRDIILYNYLKKESFKNSHSPLHNYHFDKETSENTGRADIRILPINPYRGDEAYYIIECKRLDDKNQNGETGLNGEYIKNGIARFISGKYQFYDSTAGMIGFVVAKMDIHENVLAINRLMEKGVCSEINTKMGFTEKQIVPGFYYAYYSKHSLKDSTKIIYHLMLDFTNNIETIEKA